MPLALTCQALHQMIPALLPGDAITLDRRPDGQLEIHAPATPTLLQRIAQAVRDGALVLKNPTDWEEIERMVSADRDRLRAKEQSVLAQIAAGRQEAAG